MVDVVDTWSFVVHKYIHTKHNYIHKCIKDLGIIMSQVIGS